jgi:hypothetical protein
MSHTSKFVHGDQSTVASSQLNVYTPTNCCAIRVGALASGEHFLMEDDDDSC